MATLRLDAWRSLKQLQAETAQQCWTLKRSVKVRSVAWAIRFVDKGKPIAFTCPWKSHLLICICAFQTLCEKKRKHIFILDSDEIQRCSSFHAIAQALCALVALSRGGGVAAVGCLRAESFALLIVKVNNVTRKGSTWSYVDTYC